MPGRNTPGGALKNLGHRVGRSTIARLSPCLFSHGARAVLHAAHQRRVAQQPLTRLHQRVLMVQARRGHNKAAIRKGT